MLLKVGELAKRTGLTVRTLHHYDEIGLLTPSHRTEAGYRLYDRDDLARLHRIQALKQLGFALADIGKTLASDGTTLAEIVSRQLVALDAQIERADRLRTQLQHLKGQLERGDRPEPADWLLTLELMTMHDKYFSPEDQRAIERYRRDAEPDLDTRWSGLVEAVRDLMKRGVAASDPEAQARASEWIALAEETTGNDPGLLTKFDAMTRNEPAVQASTGIYPDLLGYIMECIQARHATIYAKYLTPEELEHVMAGRAKTAQQWPPLVAAMRRLMEQGASETDPQVRELAVQWKALFDVTHAGDDGSLKAKLSAAYSNEPELLRGTGLDLSLLKFVGRAMAAL